MCKTSRPVDSHYTVNTVASWKNEPLTASQMFIAHALALDAETKLAQLDREIQALQARRAEQLDRLTTCTIALAPHKRLPPELLREIFLLCAPEAAIVGWEDEIRWVLCRVCSRWRAVARDTPGLW
ncbi:hypothetical protein DFH07DRAFT_741307, partial [Mycena maculata]